MTSSADWLVVGAGFAGSVLAERIATQRGESVLVIDRRDHIGGNAHDCRDPHGILYHKYGPHIFHTNSRQVFEYLSAFTSWRFYEHRVLANIEGQLLPFPINLDTVNSLYGLSLEEAQLADWFKAEAESIPQIITAEDSVVSQVGRRLFDTFFRNYTRKQWGLDARQLDRSVTARIPMRTNRENRYFLDEFQFMPHDGYTALFQRMLDHSKIRITTGVDYSAVRHIKPRCGTIYTGPIDEYFGHCYGRLPYRSLRFEHVTLDKPQHQPAATVNYPNDFDYTRVTEYKHMTGQRHERTVITREYPSQSGDPYYPVPTKESQALYSRYDALARSEPNVWFVGRLANYRYYNMDQVVGQALATFRRLNQS